SVVPPSAKVPPFGSAVSLAKRSSRTSSARATGAAPRRRRISATTRRSIILGLDPQEPGRRPVDERHVIEDRARVEREARAPEAEGDLVAEEPPRGRIGA